MNDRGKPQPGGAGGAEQRRTDRPRALGGALQRAWVGYQRRLDAAMAAAGFDRRFPDGRVLRLCARSDHVTASQIGRELGISRQAAGKIVSVLRDRGYVHLGPSPSDGREKIVTLAPLAREYLATQYIAARKIERDLHDRLGAEAWDALSALLVALGDETHPRMSDYLRYAALLDEEVEPT